MSDKGEPGQAGAARSKSSSSPPSGADGTVEFVVSAGAEPETAENLLDPTGETCILNSADTDSPSSSEPAATVDPDAPAPGGLGATGVWAGAGSDDAGFSIDPALARGMAPTIDPDAGRKKKS